jgi:hypothetical protein
MSKHNAVSRKKQTDIGMFKQKLVDMNEIKLGLQLQAHISTKLK